MASTTRRPALGPVPAPAERYDRQNEAEFRRGLERSFLSIAAYVDGVVNDPVALAAHTHAPADLTGFGAAGGYLRSNASAWVRVSGIAWGDLTSVPSTFAPSAHGHGAADITAGTFPSGAFVFSGTVAIADGTSTTFSTIKGANSIGDNIWIGGGGLSAVGAAGETYKGSYNIAIGSQALLANTTGYRNLALGDAALDANTTGFNNFACGGLTLTDNTTGHSNVALGVAALQHNTTGRCNTAIGSSALNSVDTATNTGHNTAIGYNAGGGITTGTGNTIIGASVTGLAAGLTNNIILAIGTGAIKAQFDGTNWTLAGALTTGTPNGGTAGAWKLGIKVDATTTFDTAKYLQVDIGGTLYKVALCTS